MVAVGLLSDRASGLGSKTHLLDYRSRARLAKEAEGISTHVMCF